MDGRRFDIWTRRLAGVSARRDALKVLLGAAGGAVLTRVTLGKAAECSPQGEFCHNGDDCCGKLVCIFKSCEKCLKKGDHCKDDADCCRGLECNHRTCKKSR